MDLFLADTSTDEVHNRPFVVADYDDAFADVTLLDEVVVVSFAVVYYQSNAVFDPMALALADLTPWVEILKKKAKRKWI